MNGYLESTEAWVDFTIWLGTQPVPPSQPSARPLDGSAHAPLVMRLSFDSTLRAFWYAWLDTPDRAGSERGWNAMQQL